jgi:hypothetical protein
MKIIQVDKFFDNPDSLRALALSLDYRSRSSSEYYEGQRSQQLHTINASLHADVCSRIITEYYGYRADRVTYTASTFFHKTLARDTTDTQWLNDRVHTDSAILTGIVYLNPSAPISSGTQTYARIDGSYVPDIVVGNRYNRLVVYPADQPHSAVSLTGQDESDARLVLLFFLESISLVG